MSSAALVAAYRAATEPIAERAALRTVSAAIRKSPDRDREANRRYRQARKALDPEAYHASRAAYQREWRRRNPGRNAGGSRYAEDGRCVVCRVPGLEICSPACIRRAMRIAKAALSLPIPRGRPCATCTHPKRDLIERASSERTFAHASRLSAATGSRISAMAVAKHMREHAA